MGSSDNKWGKSCTPSSPCKQFWLSIPKLGLQNGTVSYALTGPMRAWKSSRYAILCNKNYKTRGENGVGSTTFKTFISDTKTEAKKQIKMIVQFDTPNMVKKSINTTINVGLYLEKDLKFARVHGWKSCGWELLGSGREGLSHIRRLKSPTRRDVAHSTGCTEGAGKCVCTFCAFFHVTIQQRAVSAFT